MSASSLPVGVPCLALPWIAAWFRRTGAPRVRRFLFLACQALLLIHPLGAGQEGDFTFESDGAAVTITGYTGPGGSVAIPASIQGLPVRAIGNYAFLEKPAMTSLSIPAGVQSIGTESFGRCTGLTALNLPGSVSFLGDYAFSGCDGLVSVTIPASVVATGEGPFAHCDALQTITIAPGNPAYRSVDGVWFDIGQTTLVQYPAGRAGIYAIPGGVSMIGAGAFGGSQGLTGLVLPDSLRTIGRAAFWECLALAGISIPQGVTTIADAAFGVCGGLSSVVIPSSVVSIGRGAFVECWSLSSVTFQTGLVEISDEAFSSCRALTGVIIPASVASIGNGVFADCTALAGITVDGGNPSFRDEAGVLFDKGMSSLVQYPVGRSGTYVIPAGVVSIRDSAFVGGAGLSGLTLPAGLSAIGFRAFERCSSLVNLSIPHGIASIGAWAFHACTDLNSVSFGGSAPAFFGEHVFQNTAPELVVRFFKGAPGFTEPEWQGVPSMSVFSPAGDFTFTSDGAEITLTGYSGPGGAVAIPPTIEGLPVRRVVDNAFRGRQGVTSLSIPDSVTAIGHDAFRECPDLVAVTVGGGVTFMGDRAFRECNRLTGVTLAEGVSHIGNYAFESCRALAGLTIPASVELLGAGPFAFCGGLLAIDVAPGNPHFASIGGVLFDASLSQLIQYPPGRLGSYDIPDGVLFIGNSAFSGCSGLTGLTIPESVVSIGHFAFQYCSGLPAVVIPAGVRFIGWLAFQECGGLESVTFDGDAPDYIEANAFEGTPPGFVVRHHAGARGFTSPEWLGHPAALIEVPIDLAEALDDPGRVISTGGDAPWLGQSRVTYDGADAAAAGAIGHRQESWLETTVSGPGILSFRWKVSSEQDFDWLEFHVDGVLRDRISGEREWRRMFHPLAAGEHVLRFRYVKDGSVVQGLDSAWMDSLAWDPGEIGPWDADFSYVVHDSEVAIMRYIGAGGEVAVPPQIGGLPVRYIAEGAFRSHPALTGVTLPDSVLAIGPRAFEHCRALTSVSIGAGVTLIGTGAFRNCENLAAVTLGESLVAIYDEAFAYTALREIGIPDSVQWIDDGAFYNCPHLVAVTLGRGLSAIGDYAFSQCVSLEQVLFAADAPPPSAMGTDVFSGLSAMRVRLYYYEGSSGFGDPYWWDFPKGNRGLADGALEDAVEQRELVFTTGGGGFWRRVAGGAAGDDDSAASGAIGDSQESWMETIVSGPGILDFRWRVSSEPGYDGLEFRINGQLQDRISGETDWRIQSHFLPSGSHTLRWRYAKDSSVNQGEDRGLVDGVVWTRIPPPRAATGGHEVVTTARIVVNGLVDAKGSDADVTFEFREKGSAAKYAAAEVTPPRVAGSGLQRVTGVLDGLEQGKTYEYRVLARLAADPAVYHEGDWQDAALGSLSDLRQVAPVLSSPGGASLTVHLTPVGIGAWRVAGESGWRLSGETATALVPGPRVLEFQQLAGYTAPQAKIVDIPAGGNIGRSYDYTASPGGGTGSLQVLLFRRDGGGSGTDLRWRLTADPAGSWRDSGESLALPTGTYRIQCGPADSGLAVPADTTVAVGRGRNEVVRLYYGSTAHSLAPSAFPLSGDPVPAQVHVGQISTRAGTSTGFAVGPHAVATAAHVVFDDATLGFLPAVHWLHQRHAGAREPVARTARGSFVLSGYAARRREEVPAGAPGTSSPASYDRDGAALFFTGEVAGGGFSGFLASEAGDGNEFLSGDAQKFLSGYPAEGIPAGDLGRLHQSPVTTSALVPGHGETWTSPVPAGSPGCSGGPLLVRHPNGRFYPAAIYLGESSGKSVFRAIDRELADLFDRAGKLGDLGGQGTGGGREYASRLSGDDPSTGRVTVEVSPSEAESQARWKLCNSEGKTVFEGESGETTPELPAGSYSLEMDPLEGYLEPPVSLLEVRAGENLTFRQSYIDDVRSEIAAWRGIHFGVLGNLGDAADSADPDGDGATNLEEFEAGTDPNQAQDVFKIDSFSKSGTSFTLTVRGCKAGREYLLERSGALGGGSWEIVARTGPLPAGAPAVMSLSDPAAPGDRSFYRARVLKP